MSTSSSEEGSGISGHYIPSSGLESTGSLLSSVPSDSTDGQTEITPPPSPTLSEAKIRAPRDILDASRRLGQTSALALQGDVTPTRPKHPKQIQRRVLRESATSDEAGYDADGDGDEDEGIPGSDSAGTAATTKPTRRPTFLRIDTRQHRRVASMLATRRPSASFGDMHAEDAEPSHPPRAKRFLFPAAATPSPARSERYELQRRPRAERGAQLVGLGIGFPESHPLRHRAFTMPVSTLTPNSADSGFREDIQKQVHRQSEWRFMSPSGSLPTAVVGKQYKKKMTVQVDLDVCAPSPVRFALRPTFLDTSPSPIECLLGAFNRYDDVLGDHNAQGDARNPRTMDMSISGCDADPKVIKKMGSADALLVVRKGQLDMSEESMLDALPP